MFDLDISAPQIRVPESFTDVNSVVVVFDLGHLRWHNKRSESEQRGGGGGGGAGGGVGAIKFEGLDVSSNSLLDDDGKYS